MLRGTAVNTLLALLLVFQQTDGQSYSDTEKCNNSLLGYGVRTHVRLVGFSSASAGYLEVCKYGEWYSVTVAKDGWGRKEATVACKELGFPDAITSSHVEGRSLDSMQSSKWIHFESISCKGTENSLTDCKGTGQLRSNPTPRNLMDQALVLCNQNPVMGTVRLVGEGYAENEGILQLYNTHPSYRWSSVCSNGWTDNDADVACRQMGFASGKSKLYSFDNSARILRRKRYDFFSCNGTEETLLECNHKGPFPYRCISPKYAGVVCDGDSQEQPVSLYISIVLLSGALLVLLILIFSMVLICMAKKMKKKRLALNGRGFQNPSYEVHPFQYPDITNYVPPPTYEETILSSNDTDNSQSTTAILDTQSQERDSSTEEASNTSNDTDSSPSEREDT